MRHIEITIEQMKNGPCKGKWICYRKGREKYLHADGSWNSRAGESAYFDSDTDIENILEELEECR